MRVGLAWRLRAKSIKYRRPLTGPPVNVKSRRYNFHAQHDQHEVINCTDLHLQAYLCIYLIVLAAPCSLSQPFSNSAIRRLFIRASSCAHCRGWRRPQSDVVHRDPGLAQEGTRAVVVGRMIGCLGRDEREYAPGSAAAAQVPSATSRRPGPAPRVPPQGLRMKDAGEDLLHVLIVPRGHFAASLQTCL